MHSDPGRRGRIRPQPCLPVVILKMLERVRPVTSDGRKQERKNNQETVHGNRIALAVVSPGASRYNQIAMATDELAGSFWFLFTYDVCEEINFDALRKIVGDRAAVPEPSFHRPAPDYVRFERPPVVERLEPLTLDSGDVLRGELNYYDYGVISVKLELSFSLPWPELVARSSRLLEAPQPVAHAANTVRSRIERVRAALIRPRDPWLDEEYYVIHLNSQKGAANTAAELIEKKGMEIAQIVRGELTELAAGETDEILRSRMSYYPSDLVVVGWTAAFIHDTVEGAAAGVQLLEYANTQLLEFRYYDQVLTRVLEDVYKSLGKKGGMFARWRMARQARELNTILLEVRELTERADTAIKFLSDMYSARVYRLAADKIGVGDYRRLVDSKLHTAAELYAFMMDQFHASRAFVLELMVVIILVIELIYLFRGKR
jgi:hypothetical protein